MYHHLVLCRCITQDWGVYGTRFYSTSLIVLFYIPLDKCFTQVLEELDYLYYSLNILAKNTSLPWCYNAWIGLMGRSEYTVLGDPCDWLATYERGNYKLVAAQYLYLTDNKQIFSLHATLWYLLTQSCANNVLVLVAVGTVKVSVSCFDGSVHGPRQLISLRLQENVVCFLCCRCQSTDFAGLGSGTGIWNFQSGCDAKSHWIFSWPIRSHSSVT